MASYQNIREFYSGLSAMDICGEHSTDQNVHANYQVNQVVYEPENYIQQEVYPPPTQERNIYDSHFYENVTALQYNLTQYPSPTPVLYPVCYRQLIQSHQHSHFMAKRHRAQIKILPSSQGNFKAVVKRKRKRTVFKTEQVEVLEAIFKTRPYINREERQEIVKSLQLNDKAVKIWFQNRRLKNKKIEHSADETEDCSSIKPEEECSSPEIINYAEERSSPDIRLDFVESQIRKKTDEFGFVTLDDGVMRDLVNVIDDYLSKSLEIQVEQISETSSSPIIYEPISPASVTDSNEEDNTSEFWKPSEPNESLKRLFDLQSVISL